MERGFRRGRLIAGTMALSIVLSVGWAVRASAAELLVQISSDPYTNSTSNHRTQVEPDSFAFGTTIVSTFQVGRFFDGGASNIGWATSANGGSTWTRGFLPASTVYAAPAGKYPRASDASVAYDAKHKVWMISWLGLFPGGNPNVVDVVVSRSTDGGFTWGPPVAVSASGRNLDKNWSVCDDTATSPFYGHCYTEYDNFGNLNQFQMNTSTDGGLTWGTPKTNRDNTCVIGGQPVVQPNGTVVVPIDDCFENNIFSIRSTDGGATWSQAYLAAQAINDGHPGNIRAPNLPTAEVDGAGRVYVVFSDCRFENACSAPIGTNDLLLITSTDGINWTVPQRIPTAAVGSGADHFVPGLAVDRNTSGGSAHLGLAYYYYANSTCSPTSCSLNVGYLSSTNGGSTWSSPERLAGPLKLIWSPLTTQGYMVGDYISTSIVPGDDDATPVFMLSQPPTSQTDCSNSTNGNPGQHCHQAAVTTPEEVSLLSGGSHPVTSSASASTRPPYATHSTARAAAR